MELKTNCTIAAPVDDVWRLLNDVERVAPYIPGFELGESEPPDAYRGLIKVKVGAVNLQYAADIRVEERDETAHVVRMAVKGRERRGPGTVKAEVSSRMRPDGGQTHLELTTALRVTGRVAQFGGSVLSEVSDALIRDFVSALEAGEFASQPRESASQPGESASQPSAYGDASAPKPPVAPFDATAAAGRSMRRLATPILVRTGAALGAVLLIRLLFRALRS